MPVNERLVRHQHRELVRRLGTEIRRMREDAGLSQAAVAREAGISAGHLCEIEAGDAEPGILILGRVAAALGGELSIRCFPGTGPRIRDHLQLAMAEALLRAIHPRWRATPEVPVYRPVHGVIDLVLDDREAHLTVASELHSRLGRVEQQVRWQAQKADALGMLEERRAVDVSRLLVLRNTRAMRETVDVAAETLAAAYPGPTREAVAALTGEATWPGPAIIWVTVEGGQGRLMECAPRGIRAGR